MWPTVLASQLTKEFWGYGTFSFLNETVLDNVGWGVTLLVEQVFPCLHRKCKGLAVPGCYLYKLLSSIPVYKLSPSQSLVAEASMCWLTSSVGWIDLFLLTFPFAEFSLYLSLVTLETLIFVSIFKNCKILSVVTFSPFSLSLLINNFWFLQCLLVWLGE